MGGLEVDFDNEPLDERCRPCRAQTFIETMPETSMKTVSRIALAVAGFALAAQASAQITFYENDLYRGRSFTTERPVDDFTRFGFNDRASSVMVQGDGADRWEVCQDSRLRGRCVVLRRGEYPSLAALGLTDRITSVRNVGRDERIADSRYAPAPPQPAAPASQIVFYEREGFGGRTFTANSPVADFRGTGFNDRASSAIVTGERWEVCSDARYGGRCVVLRRGEYPSLAALGMDDQISSARGVGRGERFDESRYAPPPRPPAPPPPPANRVVFYEDDGFQGRSFTAEAPVDDFRRAGFNDRASSAVVSGGRWEVCDDAGYHGRCFVLRPGQYPSLSAMGLNDRISSVRAVGNDARVDEGRYSPQPLVGWDYGRRNEERLFEANVTSVRAVVEDSGQRCWVEREQVQVQERGGPNVPGALLGAVIGGILGHQVGGGTGKDVATGVGAVAGAAIGSNAGRNDGGSQVAEQNVQRCRNVPGQARPAYWDVTYNFRGQEYRVQMTTPPGPTVTVNAQGEPRA